MIDINNLTEEIVDLEREEGPRTDPEQEFFVEANNGGDYFQLVQLTDEYVHVQIGHCCVVVFDKVVPVEFLTNVFSAISLEACPLSKDDVAEKMLEKWCDGDSKYKADLADKLRLGREKFEV